MNESALQAVAAAYDLANIVKSDSEPDIGGSDDPEYVVVAVYFYSIRECPIRPNSIGSGKKLQ